MSRYARSSSSKKSHKRGNHVGSSSKGDMYEFRERNPKLSIDLNQPAIEEIHEGYAIETGNQLRQENKKLQAAIKELKQEKLALEHWNAKQQEKLQKLKTKRKNQRKLLKKVRKMNIKLYWHNVVLKTKMKQENIKGSSSTPQ
jgi:hypothetical protein